MAEQVLITGATGFLGRHLVQANLARGRAVRALVLPGDPGEAWLRGQGAEIVSGDIRDAPLLVKAAAGTDIVFHTAAVVTDWAPRRLFREVTVGGADNIARAALAAQVRRLVDVSTCDVFGTDETLVMDETLPLRSWGEPYPDAKIEAEKILWRRHREQGLPVAMAYPCWVYGEGDQTFVPLLADAILKRELVFWRRNALVWPTYIDNLVDLLLLIGEDDRAVGNGYLVHDGLSVTLEDFCAQIASFLGVPPIQTHIPYSLALAAAYGMEGLWRLLGLPKRPLLTTYAVKNLGSRFRFSIAKAERELGWRPRVSHEEGMRAALAWLQTLDRSSLKQK